MSATGSRSDSGMATRDTGAMFEGVIQALANKHSQIDLNFQRVTLRVPGMQQIGVELNGTITLSVHMREMTDEEKRALGAKNPALGT